MLANGVVHHFDDLGTELTELIEVLKSGGTVLVALYPPTMPHPLFPAARQQFEREKPQFGDVALALREAGLETSVRSAALTFQVPLERYADTVRSRYLPLPSVFTDDKIEVGIREIRHHSEGRSRLEIEERFIYVTGIPG